MASKNKLYDIRLRPGFPAPRRTRAGITVVAGAGTEAELSKDQVKELQQDDQFELRPVGKKELEARETAEAEADKARTGQAKADEEARDEAETSTPPTKKELLASAKDEGLELNVTEKNTVDEINQAIDEARQPASTRQMVDSQDSKEA